MLKATLFCLVVHNIMMIDPRSVYGILPLNFYPWGMGIQISILFFIMVSYQTHLVHFIVRTLNLFHLSDEEHQRCARATRLAVYSKYIAYAAVAWMALARAILFQFYHLYELDIGAMLMPGLVLSSLFEYLFFLVLRSFDLLIRKHIPEEVRLMSISGFNAASTTPAVAAAATTYQRNIESLTKLSQRVTFMKKIALLLILSMPFYGFVYLGVCLSYGERCLVPNPSHYFFTGGYGTYTLPSFSLVVVDQFTTVCLCWESLLIDCACLLIRISSDSYNISGMLCGYLLCQRILWVASHEEKFGDIH